MKIDKRFKLPLALIILGTAFIFLFPVFYKPSGFVTLEGTVTDAKISMGLKRSQAAFTSTSANVIFHLAGHDYTFLITSPDIGIWSFEQEPTAAEMVALLKPGTQATVAVSPGALEKVKEKGWESPTIRVQALALDGDVIFDRYGVFREDKNGT